MQVSILRFRATIIRPVRQRRVSKDPMCEICIVPCSMQPSLRIESEISAVPSELHIGRRSMYRRAVLFGAEVL